MALAHTWLSNIICKICSRPRPRLAVQNDEYIWYSWEQKSDWSQFILYVMLVDSCIWIFTSHMYKGDFSGLPGIFLAPDGRYWMSGVINALGTKNTPSYLLHFICSKSTCSTFLIITHMLEVQKQNHFLCFQFKTPIAEETYSHRVYTCHDSSPHWHDIAPNWMAALRTLSFPLAFGVSRSFHENRKAVRMNKECQTADLRHTSMPSSKFYSGVIRLSDCPF